MAKMDVLCSARGAAVGPHPISPSADLCAARPQPATVRRNRYTQTATTANARIGSAALTTPASASTSPTIATTLAMLPVAMSRKARRSR